MAYIRQTLANSAKDPIPGLGWVRGQGQAGGVRISPERFKRLGRAGLEALPLRARKF